jgi:hypothetical protein
MEIAKLILEYIRVLVWPTVVIGICLVFRGQLVALFNRIRHAELPGGVALDLDQEIKEVKALSAKVQETPAPPERKRGPSIPLTEANVRLIQLGMKPSPSGLDMSYYRELGEIDPNVALAGLRIEIDILARNVAKGFNVAINETMSGKRLMRKLYDSGAITSDQMQLAMKVLSVCNAAVHGTPVSREEANDVINSAEVLADNYLAWLSWGFDDGWTSKAERGCNGQLQAEG